MVLFVFLWGFFFVIFKAKQVINTELQQVKDFLLIRFPELLARYLKLKALLNIDKWSYIHFLEVMLVYTKWDYGKLDVWIWQANTKYKHQFVTSRLWVLCFPRVCYYFSRCKLAK